MNTRSLLVVVAVAIAAASALAIHLFKSKPSYALADVSVGDGVRLRIVDGPWSTEASCGTVLHALGASLRAACPTCAPDLSCSSHIDDELAAAMAMKPMAQPFVVVGTQRQIVEAPSPLAAQVCRAIAATLVAKGSKATCVAPGE